MIKAIILDLDDTLIATGALEHLRRSGRWGEIRRFFKDCKPYDDVLGLLNTARSMGIKIAIFTNSPANYAQSLLKHFKITVDFVIAYHDVSEHKPNPEGVEVILNYFQVPKEHVLYLGDSEADRGAAENAGVEFFAVEWGSVTNLDQEHHGVSKLSELIGTRLGQKTSADLHSPLQIDGNRLSLGYYLEGIKQEVWAFKDDKAAAVQRWSNKACEVSSQFPPVHVVVRALGHAELAAVGSGTPLDQLANKLAQSLGAKYRPDLLTKSSELEKSTRLSATERRKQIEGIYAASAEANLLNRHGLTFLVIDDVCTTGATTEEISRALSEAYPNSSIYVFSLVETVFRSRVGDASSELQHNTQLFADLYRQASLPVETPVDYEEPISLPRLDTKRFSANYTLTNHNFVLQNLPRYSIASEGKSELVFKAVQILKNILQRGKPTVASRQLRASFGLAPNDSGMDVEPLPLISKEPLAWERLIQGDRATGRNPAKRFFDEIFARHLGPYAFVKQLVVPEVQIFDMTQEYVEQFKNRRVDFYIPQIGIIIEIDGPQHKDLQEEDQARDEFAASLGLRTFRFSTNEVVNENESFVEKMAAIRAYIELVDNLEQREILCPPNGMTLNDYSQAFDKPIDSSDTRLRLTAAIRLQLILLELMERGQIRPGKEATITLVNRDRIDFAQQAVSDLGEMMKQLFCLLGLYDTPLNINIEEISELPEDRFGRGLIVDISLSRRYDDSHQVKQDVILCRTDYFDFYRHFPGGDAVEIENCVLRDYDYFRVACGKPVAYELDVGPNSDHRTSLRYFLSNIFLPFQDDVDFREGQVGIISSALSRNSTIGLLPTGSGKSVCYQLSALLQPAVSFVVCPIKSLMYDQKADLDTIGFSRTNFITGDLKPHQKAQIQRDFGGGKYFFVFISPERFQTHAFRREMSAIGLDLEFSYAVIDEAHCLSEWGHDFRTSYLNLANTIEKFAPAASYIGLTATASVNVLKDIQTEFDVPDEYVRTPLDFTRNELSFHVVDDRGRKSQEVVTLVSKLQSKWNANKSEFPKAGIIFTQTVNGSKGCHSLAGRLSAQLSMDVRFFSGSEPKGASFQGMSFEQYKLKVQDDFKRDQYNLLAATKAFGMGVNKGNVAYTIHFGIPGSMEALYQEAGRAGRDKKLFKKQPADCYVLLTKETNQNLLDKIWDQSTTVADLKNYAKQLSRDSDLNTNLFLMTNSLDTINDEFKLIAAIYRFLQSHSDKGVVKATAKEFGSEKARFEKAIYRLSQIGVVSDWVVEDFFTGALEVEFEIPNEEQLQDNIETTISKYSPGFKLDDVFDSQNAQYKFICDRLLSGAFSKAEFIFLVLLLWSYDHFAYNRRQSQKNVYEQCAKVANADSGAEAAFKAELEGYFKHNKSSQLLLHLAENSADVTTWLDVFYSEPDKSGKKQLISDQELASLGAQLSRFLESYKNNACLDYLSGLVRLSTGEFDDTDGKRRMASALDQLIRLDREKAETLVRETIKLKALFSDDCKPLFSRLVFEKLEDLSILEDLSVEWADAFSYHTLVTPLAARLGALTSKYREIDW